MGNDVARKITVSRVFIEYFRNWVLLGTHTVSVRALCFGRRVCLSSVCLSRVSSRKLSEIGAKFRHFCRKSGSPSKNMTSD